MFDLDLIQTSAPRAILGGMRGTYLIAGLLCLAVPTLAAGAELSDEQIRQALIARSIAMYSGNCPCPYNVDRAGRKCGRRSAYSRAGGKAPLCYPADITPEMIARFRKRQ
jgi:hypothetical protein